MFRRSKTDANSLTGSRLFNHTSFYPALKDDLICIVILCKRKLFQSVTVSTVGTTTSRV